MWDQQEVRRTAWDWQLMGNGDALWRISPLCSRNPQPRIFNLQPVRRVQMAVHKRRKSCCVIRSAHCFLLRIKYQLWKINTWLVLSYPSMLCVPQWKECWGWNLKQDVKHFPVITSCTSSVSVCCPTCVPHVSFRLTSDLNTSLDSPRVVMVTEACPVVYTTTRRICSLSWSCCAGLSRTQLMQDLLHLTSMFKTSLYRVGFVLLHGFSINRLCCDSYRLVGHNVSSHHHRTCSVELRSCWFRCSNLRRTSGDCLSIRNCQT